MSAQGIALVVLHNSLASIYATRVVTLCPEVVANRSKSAHASPQRGSNM